MCLPVSPATADQQYITVPDAGFDDHVLTNPGDYEYIGDSTYTGSWKNDFGPGDGAYIDYGYWRSQGDLEDLTGRSGELKAYPSDETTFDYIYQILDETFIEGKAYTLSVWAGNAWPRQGYADGWGLYFTAEDYKINLSEAHGLALLGDWEQISLIYTATAADAGKKIGIKMSGEEGESYIAFEDVTLSYGSPKALNPDPADGALVMDTWTSLSWSPVGLAASHDVYFSDSLDAVSAGAESAFQGNQSEPSLSVGFVGFPYPDGLIPGTTYYWRIDEVNDLHPDSPWEGDVWSFAIQPRTAYDPDPADGAEFVDPNVELSWAAGFEARLHTVYIGDNFDDVNDATGGTQQGLITYSPGPLELEKVYYWRVDEFDTVDTYKGDVWAFTTPGAVGNPSPANGATDVEMTAVLSWTPGDSATSSDVYLGTDKDAVRNATTASPEYQASRALGSESYDPGKLAGHTTYYWRVDGINNANPSGPWPGNVWSFTTADFIVVDDFESYNDIPEGEPGSNRIYLAWIDGFSNPTVNGAYVGYENPPLMERGNVHGGSQSLPYSYDNNFKSSQATLMLTSLRDWTQEGVTTLSLWFYGDPANAPEEMNVALNGAAPVYHDDSSAATIGAWTQWTIDLSELGVPLTNVTSITIGFGVPGSTAAGGTGEMLFDDIRLVRPANAPGE
jgi:hypothetical protein